MGFVDISKAYDSVNRRLLWARLSSLGFSGNFLASLQSLYTGDSIVCDVNGLQTQPVFLQRGLRQGCALSPMLFALYIADIGNDINASGLGFTVGHLTVSGLLFADDIVLFARTAAGLKELLRIVYSGCRDLKMDISEEKSQIISPDVSEWSLFDAVGSPVLALKQVLQYKYLGTETHGSLFSTFSAKQQKCIKTANKYKGACIYVSRRGPDIVDVALCTWSNIAIPAILYGCEMVPFTEQTIEAIESIQSQVAKFILGVPVSTSNVCAQTELGLKSFRHLLYERQLQFYLRVLYLPRTRWVNVALMEHLSGDWDSKYHSYICRLRSKLGIFEIPPSIKFLKSLIFNWFLDSGNKRITDCSLPWVPQMTSLSRASHVCENKFSVAISEFKLSNAGLGNRQPRVGYLRVVICPLCPVPYPNTEFHLVMQCGSLDRLRASLNIQSFINACRLKNIPLSVTFSLFLLGRDENGKRISSDSFLERGKCLIDMRQQWLGKW